MSNSGLPTKRKRADSNIDFESLPIRSYIWFDDGSIILQAEQTRFRVHQGVLKDYSKFFSDMFTLPEPEWEVLVEGCRIIRLSDTAEDWTSLLTVIYYGPQLYNSVKSYPLKLLISMLRLGNKYQFVQLRDHALERIKVELPSKLEDWDEMFFGDPEQEGEYFTKGIEFDLVNIAEELGIRSILPMAYHSCIRDQTLDAIFNGYERPDGTVAELSPRTRYILIRGRDAILRAIMDETYGWIMGGTHIPDIACVSSEDCRTARVEMMEDSVRTLQEITACALDIWDEVVTDIDRLCQHCRAAAQRAHQNGREKIWDNLPSIFGLPVWDDLNDFNS